MLQKMKKEAASRMSKAQVDEILAEKDEEIRDLRTEGENLSKQVCHFFEVHFGSFSVFGPVCKRHCDLIFQVGKQTEISRKLKSKDKSNEKEISGLKDKLARIGDENDRLKKNLSSKNEVESKQIEAVRDLTSANAQWETEAKKTASDLEDARDQVYIRSFDSTPAIIGTYSALFISFGPHNTHNFSCKKKICFYLCCLQNMPRGEFGILASGSSRCDLWP